MPGEAAVAAPVAAAPAAAAPVTSTPVAAPAAPAVQPAAAPVVDPVAPVVDGSQPVVPAVADPKAEPKASDFNDPEAFLKAHFQWRKDNGTEEGTVPEADAAKVEDKTAEQKAAEQAAADEDPAESLTPESLKTLSDANPELNALFEAKPAIKGAFYQMARENAQAKPMLELFPTVASAKFASETANNTVALRQAVMLGAEDPGQMKTAFGMFLDEFTVKGADGKPVLDARGQPQLAEDFDPFVSHMIDNYYEGELGDVSDRLKANKYGSAKEKDSDEAFVEAVKFIRAFKNSSPAQRMRPDLEGLNEEQRAYFEQLEKETGAKRDEVDQQGRNAKQTARTEARNAHERSYKATFGGNVGKRLTQIVEEKIKGGAYIPTYVLETLDPSTKISVFAKTIFDKFNAKLASIADVKQTLGNLQAKPPSEQSLKDRVEYSNKLIDDFLPPIIDAEIRLVRGKERADKQKGAAAVDKARQQVEPEPKGAATPRPRMLSEEDAYKQALTSVDSKYPGIDPATRIEKALIEKERLMRG